MKINKLNLSFFTFISILIIIDFLSLIISFELAVFLRGNILNNFLQNFKADDIGKYYWVILLSILIFAYEKIYFIRYDFWGDAKRIIAALFLTFIVSLTVVSFAKISLDYSRGFLILYFTLSIFITLLFKRVIKSILFKFDIFKVKVNIVASDKQFKKIRKEIEDNWYFGYKYCENDFEMVLISSKSFKINDLQKIIRKYSKKTKDIYVIPYMEHLDFTQTSIVDYSNIRLSAIHIENRLLNFKNVLIKIFFEKLLVVCIFPFVLLIHIIISILIKVDSRGSILFKQKRFGRNAKSFTCYKYRTMYDNNEKILKEYLKENPNEIEYYEKYHKYKNDPRITKIGSFLRKTSLDEFPQFYNVLRSDMNLIGPRPYMLSEQEKIGKVHEEVILEVKPGITGLWQVSGRNDLTFKERLDLDKWYIQNWSLWLDFVIFLKTIKVVLSKVGAH